MGGYAYPLASPGESNRYFRLATDATTEESILAEVHYLEISIRSGGQPRDSLCLLRGCDRAPFREVT